MSISQNFPAIRPTLNLNFARSKTLDPRITFTRSSTATYVGNDGLIKTAGVNQARFDHDPATGESLGLLIEEVRTNLLQYSIPNNTNWDESNSTLSINNSISPDGANNATLFTGTGTNTDAHFILRNQSVTLGTVYTQTFFVKAGTTEFVQIAPSTGFNSRYANFKLTGDGVVGNYDTPVPPTIQKYPNGWYRLRVTETAGSTTTTGRMALVSIDSLTSTRIPISEPRTFYVWGAQLEAGSFPTSYIPTSGSAAIRSQDNATITINYTNSSWFNTSVGTIIYEGKSSPLNNSNSWHWVLGINSADRYGLFHAYDSMTLYSAYTIVSGIETFSPTTTLNYNTQFKSGFAYDSFSNNQVSYIDGNLISESNSAPCPNFANTTLTLTLGKFIDNNNGNYPIDSTIKKLVYYPERLTNSQLQNLTK